MKTHDTRQTLFLGGHWHGRVRVLHPDTPRSLRVPGIEPTPYRDPGAIISRSVTYHRTDLQRRLPDGTWAWIAHTADMAPPRPWKANLALPTGRDGSLVAPETTPWAYRGALDAASRSGAQVTSVRKVLRYCFTSVSAGGRARFRPQWFLEAEGVELLPGENGSRR